MFSINFLESVLEIKKNGLGFSDCLNFCINSNLVEEKDCFIGLIGENFDGSDYFEDAILKGAIGLILSEKHKEKFLKLENTFPHLWAFFVKDTKKALQIIAREWKKQFSIPVIAVTGSIGKTTTKELIKSIFEKQGLRVCANLHSENGTIGLPLSILRLRFNHSIAIFEVGIEKIGEMEELMNILNSVTITVITTILESHLKYLKNLETVISEKIKLQNITKQLIFIDSQFKKYITKVKAIGFSDSESADVIYSSLSTKVIIDIEDKKYSVNTLYHQGFHHCLVAAFLVTYYLDVRPSIITQAIESFEKVKGRFSVHHLKSGGIIINDAYNAVNPIVMLKSLEAFEVFPTNKKKIVVFSDMLDLGELNEKGHAMIAKKICTDNSSSIEKFFCVGAQLSLACQNYQNKNIVIAKSFDEVKSIIYNYLDQKYCILFKGSNGTKLFYTISEYIKEQEVF